jgi:hypothetical protein
LVLANTLMTPFNPNKYLVFQAMWNSKEYVWDHASLTDAITMVIAFQRQDLLETMLKSRTALGIFRSLSLAYRRSFLRRFIEDVFPVVRKHQPQNLCEKIFRHNLVTVSDYQSSALRYYASAHQYDPKGDLRKLTTMFAEDKPRLRDLMWADIERSRSLYVQISVHVNHQPELKAAMEEAGILKHLSP